MQIRALLAMCLVGYGCAEPAAVLVPSDIRVDCQVQMDGQVECNFTNLGGNGSGCVRPVLKNRADERSTRSSIPLCSGRLGPQSSSHVLGRMLDTPMGICGGDLYIGVLWGNCLLEVPAVGQGDYVTR